MLFRGAKQEEVVKSLWDARSDGVKQGDLLENQIEDLLDLARDPKNLLENAYKYASPSENIEIIIFCDSRFVNITVKDRGPGIDAGVIKNITKAFVRGKHHHQAGFGLGLSICYKVVKAHGGDLQIINNTRGGSSFTLQLPKK